MSDLLIYTVWQDAEKAEQDQNYWPAIELYSQLLLQTSPDAAEETVRSLRLQAIARRGRLLAIVGEPAAALAGYDQYYRETRTAEETVEALLLIGWQCTRMGLSERAHTTLQTALNLAAEQQFHSGKARALARLGAYWQELGQYTKALHHLEQAEMLIDYVADWRGRMRITNALGNAHLGLGQFDKAILAYNRALTYAQQIGAEETAMIFNNLGETYQMLFDKEQAYHYQQQALALVETAPFSQVKADLYRNLGYVLCQTGQTEIGLPYLHMALQLSRNIKQISVEMQTLYSLALAELDCGRLAEAHQYAQTLIDLARQHQVTSLWVGGLYVLGLYYRQTGEKEKAEQRWQQAIFMAHESGHRVLLWQLHAALGGIIGDPALAQAHLAIAADMLFQMAQPIADVAVRRKFLSAPPVRAVLMAAA